MRIVMEVLRGLCEETENWLVKVGLLRDMSNEAVKRRLGFDE